MDVQKANAQSRLITAKNAGRIVRCGPRQRVKKVPFGTFLSLQRVSFTTQPAERCDFWRTCRQKSRIIWPHSLHFAHAATERRFEWLF